MKKTFVKLIRVVSGDRCAVEVVDVKTNQAIRLCALQALNFADGTETHRTRLHLLQVADTLPEGEVAIIPRRYCMRSPFVSAEDAGLEREFRAKFAPGGTDEIDAYNVFEYRGSLPAIEGTRVPGAGKPIATLAQAFEGKVQTKGCREERGGKQTKASVARGIIKDGLDAKKDPETIIAQISEQCGFKLALARVYFRENVRKVTEKPE